MLGAKRRKERNIGRVKSRAPERPKGWKERMKSMERGLSQGHLYRGLVVKLIETHIKTE